MRSAQSRLVHMMRDEQRYPNSASQVLLRLSSTNKNRHPLLNKGPCSLLMVLGAARFNSVPGLTADHKNLSSLPRYMAYLLRSNQTPLGWSGGTSGG
jgi:hypothetical protein